MKFLCFVSTVTASSGGWRKCFASVLFRPVRPSSAEKVNYSALHEDIRFFVKCRTGPEIHHRLLAGRCSFVSFFTNVTYTHFCLYFFTFSSRAKEQRQERFAWSVVGGSFLSVVLQRCQSLILHANAQKCHAKDRAAFCHPSSFVFPFRLARQVVGSFFFTIRCRIQDPKKRNKKDPVFLSVLLLRLTLCVCVCVGVWVCGWVFCVSV